MNLLKVYANGLQLQEVGNFEALNFNPAQNLVRSTKLHLSTEPTLLPNACYSFVLILVRSLSVRILQKLCIKILMSFSFILWKLFTYFLTFTPNGHISKRVFISNIIPFKLFTFSPRSFINNILFYFFVILLNEF